MKLIRGCSPAHAVALLCLAVLAVTAAGAADKPSAKFKTAGAPGFITAYRGWIWVGAHRSGLLYKIDPRTDKTARTYNLPEDVCGLGGTGPDVWAGTCDGVGALVNIRTGKIRQARTEFPPISYAGSLWLTRHDRGGRLQRVDPKTRLVLKTWRGIDVEGPPRVGSGAIWIPGLTTLSRFDATDDTRTIIPLPGAKSDPGLNQGYATVWNVAITPGTIWVPNPAGVYRVNERTNTATLLPRLRVGNLDEWGNIAIAAARGSLFVRLSPNQVERVNPNTGTVTARYPATGGGGDIAVAYGSLWVTNFAADTTWRIPIR